MAKTEPFNIPDLKDSVGWRLNDEDKQNLRIIMAERQDNIVSNILRDLVQHEATAVRQKWLRRMERRMKEDADG